MIGPDDKIISAASCTTNAITPVLRVMQDRYGIRHGHVETVHSTPTIRTSSTTIIRGERRGRSAALNMVMTSTGAAKAVAKALPELRGKLTGNAIRVPTPNVSPGHHQSVPGAGDRPGEPQRLSATDGAELGPASPDRLQRQYRAGLLRHGGIRFAGIVDSQATIAEDHCVLYVWYDNEFGTVVR